MKRLIPFLLLFAVTLAGCASKHAIHMVDGRTVLTEGNVDFDEDTGEYSYKNNAGKEFRLRKEMVESIEEH